MCVKVTNIFFKTGTNNITCLYFIFYFFEVNFLLSCPLAALPHSPFCVCPLCPWDLWLSIWFSCTCAPCDTALHTTSARATHTGSTRVRLGSHLRHMRLAAGVRCGSVLCLTDESGPNLCLNSDLNWSQRCTAATTELCELAPYRGGHNLLSCEYPICIVVNPA